MREVLVVERPAKGHIDALMRRIKKIHKDGGRTLLVCADRSYSAMKEAADKAKVEDVMFLDLISQSSGDAPTQRPRDVVFIPSATMLEMVAMRIEQMQKMMGGDVHVIVDSLSTLLVYNNRKAVEEFAHYLVNRLRTLGMAGDLLVHDDKDGKDLGDAVGSYTDGTKKIGDLK